MCIIELCEYYKQLYYDTCSVCVYVHMYAYLLSCTSAPKPAATAPTAKEQFLISPITGERIPVSKMTEHMRYGM